MHIYRLAHYHKYGETDYFFKSEKNIEWINLHGLDILIKKLEIDYEEDKDESISIDFVDTEYLIINFE